MRIVSLITLALAALALAASSATAGGAKAKSGFFKTQNGKIYCIWGTGARGFVVCGIRNGHLKPKPKAKCRIGDPTGGWLNFNRRGRTHIEVCSGDAGPFADPAHTRVLKAGKKWSGGGMSCTATASSMRCKNKSNHGFNITTAGAYQRF
jgi:Family of unknown function (DUF6636)